MTSVIVWAQCGWFAVAGSVKWCRSGHRSGDSGWWQSCGSGRGVREGGIIIDGKRLGVRVEFERTTKMESENESKNEHFWKSEGRVQFKNDCFSVHCCLILMSISWKMRIKIGAENGLKMATVNNPIKTWRPPPTPSSVIMSHSSQGELQVLLVNNIGDATRKRNGWASVQWVTAHWVDHRC